MTPKETEKVTERRQGEEDEQSNSGGYLALLSPHSTSREWSGTPSSPPLRLLLLLLY